MPSFFFFFLPAFLLPVLTFASDPFAFFDWTVSYIDASPLGVKQKVFPGAWTAILVSLDNAGIWNLRAENLDSWYLGQETYLSVVNPEKDSDEVTNLPADTIYCGLLSPLQRDQAQRVNFSGASSAFRASKVLLISLVVGAAVGFFT